MKLNFKQIYINTIILITALINLSFAEDVKSEDNPTTASATIKVEQTFIKEKSIYLNEPFHYIVSISWKGTLGDFKILIPDDPQVDRGEVKNLQVSNSTYADKNSSLTQFAFTINPTSVGKGSIGSIDIEYQYKDDEKKLSLTTRAADFEVLPSRTENGKIIVIVFLAITIGLIVIVITLSLINMCKIRNINKQEKEKELDIKSPYDAILLKTRELLGDAEGSDISGYYSKLKDNMMDFLTRYTGKSVKKFTNRELCEFLETSDLQLEVKDKIISIQYQCEQVQFGGYKPQVFEKKSIIRDLLNIIEEEDRKYINNVKEQIEKQKQKKI